MINEVLNYNDMDNLYGTKRKTKSDDAFRDYLQDIADYPLLTSEEEVKYSKIISENTELLKELKTHLKFDENNEELKSLIEKKENEYKFARSMMVNSNLRLVVSIAKHYVGKGLDILDLVQEGNMGLMKAVDKYDYTLGYKFSTYASWWIRQAVTRAIGDYSRVVRLPVHMHEKVNKLKSIEAKYYYENGSMPSEEELSLEMNLPVEYIRELSKYKEGPLSLYTTIGEDEESELIDFVYDENANVEEEVLEDMNHNYVLNLFNSIESLSDKEKFVMMYRNGFPKEDITNVLGENAINYIEEDAKKRGFRLRWGEENTLENTSKVYGVTRERIRQIQKKATNKIKKHLIFNNPDLALDYVNMYSEDYNNVLHKIDNRAIKRKSFK